MELTCLALWVRLWITDNFAEMGWLELLSKYLSVWVGFLYTVDLMDSGVGLVRASRKGRPSVLEIFVVNLVCGSMEFRCS